MHTGYPHPEGHQFRYHLAAGFVAPGDIVVDAACGAGYGAGILLARGRAGYVGVDLDVAEAADAVGSLPGAEFVEADLQTWTAPFAFDVFVGFETVEHLDDYRSYVAHAKLARRWIIVSVPVVPTVHINEWHRHDFAPGVLVNLFVDDHWCCFQTVGQPSELAEVYVFSRRA